MKMYLYEHLTHENFIQKFPDLWYTTTNTHARDKCACFSSIVGHHPTLCVCECMCVCLCVYMCVCMCAHVRHDL